MSWPLPPLLISPGNPSKGALLPEGYPDSSATLFSQGTAALQGCVAPDFHQQEHMEGKSCLLPTHPFACSCPPASHSPSGDNSPPLCWRKGMAAKAEIHVVCAGACSTARPPACEVACRLQMAYVQPPFPQPSVGSCLLVNTLKSAEYFLADLCWGAGCWSQPLGQRSPLLHLLSTRHQQDSSISRTTVLVSAHHTRDWEPQKLSAASRAASSAPHLAPRRG